MTVITFTVHAKPVPKARARTVRGRDGRVHSYTPKKTTHFEQEIRDACHGLFEAPAEGAVNLDLTFAFEPPASASRPEKQRRIAGRHTIKPDLDNLAKAVKDALNGIAWVDDAQIDRMTVRKAWRFFNGVIVEVWFDGDRT